MPQFIKAKPKKRIILGGLALFFCLFPVFAFAAKNSPPVVISVSPAIGASKPDLPVIFTTTCSDPDGWQNIQYIPFLINAPLNGKNCFYAYYNQNTNKLYLRNNANSKWLGGYAPGSSNIIENSFAKLDCSQSSVAGQGTTLTVKWGVIFKPAFSGNKNIYLNVVDDAKAGNHWLKKGTWSIAINPSPVINSITPQDKSVFFSGASIDIQINASDPYNDPLEYQFSLGGKLIQSWSASNTYKWQTASSDKGYINIACEVRDNKGAKAVKVITCQIINPSAQRILRRASKNYIKIHDLKADMTMTSTLNGKPFGDVQYCRYYFKAPNKEKTETYSDSSRTQKTEAIIIKGYNMYLVNPINKMMQAVNLLDENGITSGQFNQTDIYYKLNYFLTKHFVSRNNAKTDLKNNIICIDTIPKVQNNLYTKMELYVDWNKGLLISIAQYKDNEPPQVLEAIESLQMPNGAWVVSKLKKNPNLTAGNLIAILSYDNIKINTGMNELTFDPNKQY